MPAWEITVIAVSSAVLIFLILFFFIGIKFYDFALSRKHNPIPGERKPLKSPDGKYQLDYDWDFINNTKSSIVAISSFDQTVLLGHFFKNENGLHRYVITCHGYRGEWQELSKPVRYLYEQLGYSVLMIEERGQGGSGFPIITMGDKERIDIAEWTKFVAASDPKAQICLFGLSMGASSVMMSLTSGVAKNVKCAIADCGYSSIKKQFAYSVKAVFHLPPFLILPAAQTVAWLAHKVSFSKHSPVKSLKKNDTPILLIQGEEDTYVPYSNLQENFNSVKEGTYKQKESFPQAWHAMSFIVDLNRYNKVTGDFLNKFIK
jgi:fermentation-respiration switch protein FrsA (DUF1100 family)